MIEEVIVSAVVAIAGQIVFYFIKKGLDIWWNSHFPPSNGNTAP